jgi:hypothetical protein
LSLASRSWRYPRAAAAEEEHDSSGGRTLADVDVCEEHAAALEILVPQHVVERCAVDERRTEVTGAGRGER